ncbi:hypothetical protein B0T14DRAFT_499130 [Immersiella caudata]|uniref:Uncharacterized protein n=1 Tax=Immersiella caudata TaxID=314043 RepID=A0AA39WE43_9PEZI|nr:hypothetical protein B0T14DRAFT_499130 [Immersiella caudata]
MLVLTRMAKGSTSAQSISGGHCQRTRPGQDFPRAKLPSTTKPDSPKPFRNNYKLKPGSKTTEKRQKDTNADGSPALFDGNEEIAAAAALVAETSDSLVGKEANQPGIQPFPPNVIKALVRFANPKATLNDDVRIESGVAAMTLACDVLKSLDSSIIPSVHA